MYSENLIQKQDVTIVYKLIRFNLTLLSLFGQSAFEIDDNQVFLRSKLPFYDFLHLFFVNHYHVICV